MEDIIFGIGDFYLGKFAFIEGQKSFGLTGHLVNGKRSDVFRV